MQRNADTEILVLDSTGTNLGRMPYRDAKSLSLSYNLDLVQVNKNSDGVVVYKIMDYGKHKYEQKKHKQKKISHPLKEMNFKMRIDPHDLQIKVNRIRGFLSKGSDVKITVTMRGRERASPQLAQEKLDSILLGLEGLVLIQQKKATRSSMFVTVRPLPGKGKGKRKDDIQSSGSSESRDSNGDRNG